MVNSDYRLGEIMTDGYGDKWLKIVEGETNNKIQYLSIHALVALVEALKIEPESYFSRGD